MDCIFEYRMLASFPGKSSTACVRWKSVSRDLNDRSSLWTPSKQTQSGPSFGHQLSLICSFQSKVIQDSWYGWSSFWSLLLALPHKKVYFTSVWIHNLIVRPSKGHYLFYKGRFLRRKYRKRSLKLLSE